MYPQTISKAFCFKYSKIKRRKICWPKDSLDWKVSHDQTLHNARTPVRNWNVSSHSATEEHGRKRNKKNKIKSRRWYYTQHLSITRKQIRLLFYLNFWLSSALITFFASSLTIFTSEIRFSNNIVRNGVNTNFGVLPFCINWMGFMRTLRNGCWKERKSFGW